MAFARARRWRGTHRRIHRGLQNAGIRSLDKPINKIVSGFPSNAVPAFTKLLWSLRPTTKTASYGRSRR